MRRYLTSLRLALVLAIAVALVLLLPVMAQAGNRKYRNPAAQAWVERVFTRLAAVSGRPRSAYSLTMLDETQVNAFAGPKGDVYVTRALLAMVTSDDELAAVLGHEMAHITRGHLRKLQYQQIGTSVLAGIFAAATQNETVGELGRIGASLATLKFSRKEEQEADDVGAETMTRAGFNPRAMVSMLEKLEKATGSAPALEFLQNHPDTANRVKRARARLGRFPADALGRPMALTFGQSSARSYAPRINAIRMETIPAGDATAASGAAVSGAPRTMAAPVTGTSSTRFVTPGGGATSGAVSSGSATGARRASTVPASAVDDDDSGWEPRRLKSGATIMIKKRGTSGDDDSQ